MEKIVAASRVLLAIAILALAWSIYTFTLEAKQVRVELPTLLTQIDQTAQRITPVVEEVQKIQAIIPSILEQSEKYQQAIPEVLARVDDINRQIPVILNEVQSVTAAIPPILEQSNQWHSSLPSLLEQVEQTNKTIRATNQQIAATNKQVPAILAESEALRVAMPEVIRQAESLVEQAEQAGREASKGAVTGVIGGILSSPFQLVDSLTSQTFGVEDKSFSDKDQQLHKQAVESLLRNPSAGQTIPWKNTSSGNSGTVSIQSTTQNGSSTCYSILSRLTIAKGTDKGTHSIVTERCVVSQ
jgi:surface antigen/archaellum component FlaC